MNLTIDDFIDKNMAGDFMCPICLDIMYKIYEIDECGHIYCGNCINLINICPICKNDKYNNHRSKFLERKLYGMELICPHDKCNKKLFYQEYKLHLVECHKDLNISEDYKNYLNDIKNNKYNYILFDVNYLKNLITTIQLYNCDNLVFRFRQDKNSIKFTAIDIFQTLIFIWISKKDHYIKNNIDLAINCDELDKQLEGLVGKAYFIIDNDIIKIIDSLGTFKKLNYNKDPYCFEFQPKKFDVIFNIDTKKNNHIYELDYSIDSNKNVTNNGYIVNVTDLKIAMEGDFENITFKSSSNIMKNIVKLSKYYNNDVRIYIKRDFPICLFLNNMNDSLYTMVTPEYEYYINSEDDEIDNHVVISAIEQNSHQ